MDGEAAYGHGGIVTGEPIVPPAQTAQLPDSVSGRILIDKLSFSYPSRPNTLALNELSLEVPPAKSLALVGASGAGKSTLIDLIFRFYDPQQGTIFFDGTDVSLLDPKQLRKHLAIVPQNPMLFTGSVIDNIRYGNEQCR